MRKLASVVAVAALMAMSALPAMAASAQSQTKVVVDSSISITAPLLLDFGHGIVGANLTIASNAGLNVITNNEAGYTITSTISNLTGDGQKHEVIHTGTDFNVAFAGETANTPDNGGTYAQSVRSEAAGDGYAISGAMVVPFVESATYLGTADFVAAVQ